MRFSVDDDHIYLHAELAGEILQIKDAKTQLERYRIAHKFWGGDSLYIYTKSKDQYDDENKKDA